VETVYLCEYVAYDVAYGEYDNAGREDEAENAHQLYCRDVSGYKTCDKNPDNDHEPL
jgi:hypothetical protein